MLLKRYLLVMLGWVCVTLGVIGIFLPLLPTTVFLLIAAWCFARSSNRFHQWLLNHKRLGPMIKTWQEGKGIPRRVRFRVICLIWLSMGASMLIIAKLWATLLLLTIGSAVTLYLMRQPLIEDAGGNGIRGLEDQVKDMKSKLD